MSGRFKAGDVVRRLTAYQGGTWGRDLGSARDATYVVKSCVGGDVILCDVPSQWSSNRFELVQESRHPATKAPAGRKDDSGKLDMTLLDDMPRALKAVVEVMQWAIEKKKPTPYVRGSWLGVHPDRYRAAIQRHNRDACEQASAGTLPARLQRDPETELLHLSHQACSALMALENTLRELEKANANAPT